MSLIPAVPDDLPLPTLVNLCSQLRLPDTVPRGFLNAFFREAAVLHLILERNVPRCCPGYGLLPPSLSQGRPAVMVDLLYPTFCCPPARYKSVVCLSWLHLSQVLSPNESHNSTHVGLVSVSRLSKRLCDRWSKLSPKSYECHLFSATLEAPYTSDVRPARVLPSTQTAREMIC